MTLQIGDNAPEFTMPADDGSDISLSNYKGEMVILYFYPKDDTPGCTKQACAFTENLTAFNDLNCAVIGVSKDPVTKHQKFKAKYDLNFPLASDENTDVCERYGVWTEKSMYGKTYMGIERTTFLIDSDGIIQHIWNKVKVPNHIADVLNVVNQHIKKAA
jgi:peroxiredoxin Q/BCP